MNSKFVVAGAAFIAVFAGVLYYARDPAQPTSATSAKPAAVAAPEAARSSAAAPAPRAQGPMLSRVDASARPAPPDPRLAALMGPAVRDDLVQYLAGPDGRVIQEIDQDTNSRSYQRPLREYLYSGDKMIGVTAYRYLGDQVQIVRAAVAYKPDGSVGGYRESTEYVNRTPASAPNN